jgi:hypothetical protein
LVRWARPGGAAKRVGVPRATMASCAAGVPDAPPVRPTSAELARHERLRDVAAEYGVSHQTVRAVVRRTRTAAQASALAAG